MIPLPAFNGLDILGLLFLVITCCALWRKTPVVAVVVWALFLFCAALFRIAFPTH